MCAVRTSPTRMSSIDPVASVPILFEDAYLIAVVEPSGIPVQPDPTGDADLLGSLATQRGGRAPGLVHRLDRPVSGVVVFALDDGLLAALNALVRDRGVWMHMWATVSGSHEVKS